MNSSKRAVVIVYTTDPFFAQQNDRQEDAQQTRTGSGSIRLL